VRKFAEALAIFEEARPLDPNHSVLRMHRGLALSRDVSLRLKKIRL